jgi:hypothetical protein
MSRSRNAPALLAAVVMLSPALARSEEGPIQDNSFLIEEAYNQEPGVIQHISSFTRARGGAWAYSFTEEWPVQGQTHQASVTVNYARPNPTGDTGVGDLALNYRWQAIGSGETPVAFAPRLTLLLPSGDASRGLGAGGTGLQVNLPLSVMLGSHFVTHANVGGTYVPSARVDASESAPLTTFAIGQSVIWLTHPNFNLMLEALYTNTELSAKAGVQRTESLTINPGVRGAINFASGLQIVPGVSIPLGVGPSSGERSVLFYLSFEHPFRLAGPTEEHKS